MYNKIMFKRVYIEITNQCNLNCTFCKKNSRNIYYMNKKEFVHILDQIKDYTRYIYLHVQGEPLMHPLLEEFINIAKEKYFNIQIVTNGSLIDKCNFLLEGNVRKISISLHSISYQSIDIDKYYDNIIKFSRQASELNKTYIELRFNNEDIMDNKTKFLLNKLESNFDFKITSKDKSYKIMNNVFVAFNNIFEWPSLSNDFVSDKGYCLGGINMLAILSNGLVSICCLDSEGDINLGNIYTNNLKEILESDKYLNIINGFKNRKVIEPLCKHCTYRLIFNK
ncbi:MAG TPA: radical SAM protein [Erysipelotrichaceae bacterium]|nr:radical SAM protein [Erysipelotrichaceae bacterium]